MRFIVAVAVVTWVVAAAAVPPVAANEFDCLIQPYDIVSISSPVQGIVERVTVNRGDLVTAGTVLIVLESSTEKAALAIARARAEAESGLQASKVRVEFGNRRYDRTLDLFKRDLVPLKEMDEAETTKILAEIALVEAQEQKLQAELEAERVAAALALRTIRSPITGIVLDRNLSPGEFAGASPVLRLAQIDPLRVEVFVPIRMLGKVKVASAAEVVPEPPLNRPRRAHVTVVDKVVDAASGMFGVRLEMPNPGNELPAGLRCRVRFLGEGQR